MSGLTLAGPMAACPDRHRNCAMMPPMLLRLAYLGITNAFALLRLLRLLRLLPGGDRDKDIEILSLRHQLAVLATATRRAATSVRAGGSGLAGRAASPAAEADPAAAAAAGPARHHSQVAP